MPASLTIRPATSCGGRGVTTTGWAFCCNGSVCGGRPRFGRQADGLAVGGAVLIVTVCRAGATGIGG
jgi:hypothetical protein